MSPEKLYEQIATAMPTSSEAERLDVFWQKVEAMADENPTAAIKMLCRIIKNQGANAERDYHRLHDLAITAFNA